MIVSLQSWASHYCLALLLLITCRYSNTQQTFYLSMCVCMHMVCATASSVYIRVFPCVKVYQLCSVLSEYVNKCVCVLLCSGWEVGNNNPSLVKHIQCSLNDQEREIQRMRDRNVWDSLVWSRSSALCWCMMGIGFHLLFSVTICYVVIQWKLFRLEIQNLLFSWR